MSESFKCIQCGRNFILSYSEQRYYRERGWNLPRRCDACRAERRQGQEISSPTFSEKGDKPNLNGAHPNSKVRHSPRELFIPDPPRVSSSRSSAEPQRPQAGQMSPYYRFGWLSL